MERVPFICVNYNSSDETVKYISNVSLLSGGNQIIIVVDNSPNANEYDKLDSFIKEENYSKYVHLIRRDNKGYFQGLNDGLRYCYDMNIKFQYAVVGNNDIIFNEHFLKNIQSITVDNNTMILAPDVVTSEGSHENPHVLKKMSIVRKLKYKIMFSNYFIYNLLWKLKGSKDRRFKDYDGVRKEIYMGIGALYVLTPNFFKHFNYLWEEVFLYGEEAILTGQIHSVGGKIMYEPNLICFHNESSTTSKIKSKDKFLFIKESYKSYKKYL